MSKAAEKAARAKRLRADEAFQEFISEVLEDQKTVFMNAASDEARLAEAHAIVRAVSKIEAKLKAAETNARIEQKRKSKRSAP